MGEQMVFKRYEIKYMLTKGQRELIQNRMRDYMTMDVHGKNTILSLEERQLEQYVKNHVPPKDTQIMRELATTFKNNRETEEITNMLNTVFAGIFEGTTGVAVPQFLGCLLVSLLIGLFFAWVYNRKNTSSQSFAVTLALLPAIVCGDYDGERERGSGSCCGRGFQPGSFPLGTGDGQGDCHALFSHGRRAHYWHGIPGIRRAVCTALERRPGSLFQHKV